MGLGGWVAKSGLSANKTLQTEIEMTGESGGWVEGQSYIRSGSIFPLGSKEQELVTVADEWSSIVLHSTRLLPR